MKKLIGILVSGCIAVAAAVMPLSAAGNKVVIEGSTTVLPIAQAAAEEFMNIHPDVNINVRGGGSGVGVTSLIEGTCDIADCSRSMKDAELQKAAGRGKDPKAYVIAMDGIAVIVHPSNPVQGLTKKQVQDMYTGKTSNWADAGGKNAKIVVISRDSASGTFEAFSALALNGKKVRPDALMQASNQAIAGTVAQTPGAIGYIGIGYLTNSVKAVPIDGVAATKQTVLSGKYPYARPLYMYTNGPAKGAAKSFIDYILSPAGQKIVEEEGFVRLK